MDPSPGTPSRAPNRLAGEQSPYLLQHAHDPVDWYAWGEEAFTRARVEDRPILLSIGYSTCHWCHVMARESFADEGIAELLNAHFVCIKLDREERPDVDRVYMTAMQAMGMGGGWPLNVFLTPMLEPFFGGTYFPPTTRGGHAGMREILPRVHAAWIGQREKLEQHGAQLLRALASLAVTEPGPTERAPLIDEAFLSLARIHDDEAGGFGGSPKFPSTANLDLLARLAATDPARRDAALGMLTRQLDAMAAGGIRDHLDGGFHRYATDRRWAVPHFEKMLYDQALIAGAYLDGYLLTGNERYAEVVRGILGYVARDLSAPGGGFYSAEDADSEGEEGRFHVWTPAQVEEALGARDAALFRDRYGVTDAGNFEHGATVLSEARALDEVAAAHGITPADAASRLAAARAELLAARATRPRPHRDEKVIAAWNGLMISAFARAGRVLHDDALRARAVVAATFVWETLRDPATGTLRRRWCDGHVAGAGMLEDHANVALGLLDLYAADRDPVWLARAAGLTTVMVERFHDPEHGGFFTSTVAANDIGVRMKDDFDGAEIAGNSIAAQVVQSLAELLDRDDWRAVAKRTFDAYAVRLRQSPAAMPRMLAAMDLERATPRQIIIVGIHDAADTLALAREVDRRMLPYDRALYVDPHAPGALADLAPFAVSLAQREPCATAYVCVDRACSLPVTDPRELASQLETPLAASR